MRRLAIGAGIALIALAFAAATRVADTREGLIAEVVTLLGGLAGIGLFLYGLLPRRARTSRGSAGRPVGPTLAHPAREIWTGVGGLLLAAILLSGLAASAGWQWAALGSVLLMPMIAGSAYLCARFLRAR